MARLPVPGQDDGAWGGLLNDFLSVAHASDGALKPIAQANVTGMAQSLADKADDSAVVHRAGTEIITGAKDFTGGLTVNGTAIVLANDSRLATIGLVTAAPYNADPTGVADATAAFQAAINDGDIAIPAGTYRVGHIVFEGASRRITALGPVTITQIDANGVFDLRGGWDTLGSVTTYTSATVDLVTPGESNPASSRSQATQLTMAGAATVSVGDVVKIVSDDQVVTGRTANERRGEYSLVGIASSGTSITLTNVLIDTYTTNPRLARLRDVRFSITGPITFDTTPSIRNTTVFGAVILLRAAQNCLVEGVTFCNSLGRAIGTFTYACAVRNCTFRNLANRPTLSHWGYGVQDGGWMLRMESCWGENLRHLYTEGSNVTTAGSTSYEYFGGGWFAHISDCVGQNCQAQVFDTHGTAFGTTFSDCKAIGTFVGASSGGAGFVARGRNIHFKDCYAYGGELGFSVTAAGSLVENCIARRCKYIALSIGGDTSDAPHVTTVGNIRVVGGEYESESSSRTVFLGTVGYTISASLERCRLRMIAPDSGSAAIRVIGTVNLRGEMITSDVQDVTGSVPVIFIFCEGTLTARIRGSRHLGGTGQYTTYTFVSGVVGGAGSDIELSDLEYEHASQPPTLQGGTAVTRYKYSYRSKGGPNWWENTASAYMAITASAGGSMDNLRYPLDQTILVNLTGSNGAVTVGALPTPSLTNPAQRIVIYNGSNGDVTIPNGLGTIIVGGSAEFANMGNVWRRLS